MSFRSSWVRLGLIALIVAGLAAGWASFGQYERSVRIQAEIDTLRHEAERIERENATLSEKIEFFASPDFKESEAKSKLGLRRQEEKVVAIEGDMHLLPSESASGSEENVETRMVRFDVPNYEKWWRRFFEKERAP
ncbi:MAG: septum formation initiator family protein [Undibacterium sp.]